MFEYPSIPSHYELGKQIIAFSKIDGSQLRAKYSAKRGFYKFGTRTQLIDEKAHIFGESISLIKNKYEESLNKIFGKQHWKKVLVFFEFYGENSIAGMHNREPHDVTLIDIAVENKGLLEPDKFCDVFSDVEIAKVLYKGEITEEFIESVKEGSLKEMGSEGVVAKGKYIEHGLPYMCKIKTHKWLDLLKERCKGDLGMFEKLK